MSLLKRVEAHKGLAPREEAVAPPVVTRSRRLSCARVRPRPRPWLERTRCTISGCACSTRSAPSRARCSTPPSTEAAITIEGVVSRFLQTESFPLTAAERKGLVDDLVGEVEGLGPLEPLLHDGSITEVMVNGPRHIYIERNGKIERVTQTFLNDEHVLRIINRIVTPLGRRIDLASPRVDARLPDGSRVNAIIPPLSLVGPTITIRKFSTTPYTVADLVRFGTASAEMFEFLRACVEARLNLFVSGGTGSGKTTTLNVISSFIPEEERIITIEDAAELQLNQKHVVTLEARPSNLEGMGEVTIRELLRNALHMRPDRVVVGECRSGEALDMLQAMTIGQEGSMSTGHANSPPDMLRRLETMVLMAGTDLPLRSIREQIASAVDLIVHTARLKDGSRKIVKITEVYGIEDEKILMQDIFEFEQTGTSNGRMEGDLKPTGKPPTFMDRFEPWGSSSRPASTGSRRRTPRTRPLHRRAAGPWARRCSRTPGAWSSGTVGRSRPEGWSTSPRSGRSTPRPGARCRAASASTPTSAC